MVEEVGHPAVRLLYDMYHSAMMDEDPAAVLGDRGGLVGHVHVADLPGRHEPGSGTIDWRSAMAKLAAKGYRGPIELEFWPTAATIDALRLMRRELTDAAAGSA